MVNPVKVATPETAETMAVPDNVPLPGFVLMLKVTGAEEFETVFPNASWIVTVRSGEIDAPAVVLEG